MFSIETTTTIGYGIRNHDPYMDGCSGGMVILFFVMVASTVLDAMLLGLIYARISRADKRGRTICFSNKAVIRRVNGVPYFMFQVCEMRSHQLVEAHVRCYCIRRWKVREASEQGPKVVLQQQAMRLQVPDDELGGMLFLGIPALVVHRIDAWSPLMPHSDSPMASSSSSGSVPQNTTKEKKLRDPRSTYEFPEILQRAADVDAGERDGGKPFELKGRSASETKGGAGLGSPTDESMADFFKETRMEIMVVVEGIDPVTSNTASKVHSYTVTDVEWRKRFAACATEGPTGQCEIDFERFHELLPEDAEPGRPAVQG